MNSAVKKYSEGERRRFLSEYRQQYREQDEAAQRVVSLLNEGKRHIIVEAEEKSGKRMIKILAALVDALEVRNGNNPYHIYIVGLNRKDIHPQLEDFWKFGIDAVIIRSQADSLELSECLKVQAAERNVVIHLDEADYATGNDQILRPLKPLIFGPTSLRFAVIGYSATPQEPLFGDVCELHKVTFTPHPTYRGANWFLDSGRVRKPEPFIIVDEHEGLVLSPQAKEILAMLHKHPGKKNVAVVRLTGKNGHFNSFRSLYNDTPDQLSTWGFIADFVDFSCPKDWSRKGGWLKTLNIDLPQIIFINQTCSRSTEVNKDALEKKVLVWHDCRFLSDSEDDKKPSRPAYNTLAQAFGRFKHYHANGVELYPYIDEEVWLFQTGRKDWTKERIKLSNRIVSRQLVQQSIATPLERELIEFASYVDLQQHVRENDWDTTVGDPCMERSAMGYYISGPNHRVPRTVANLREILLATHLKPPIGGKAMRSQVNYFRSFVGYEKDTFKVPIDQSENKLSVILFRCRNNSLKTLTWTKTSEVHYTAHRSVFANAADLDQISDEIGAAHIHESLFRESEVLALQQISLNKCRSFVKDKLVSGLGVHWPTLMFHVKQYAGKDHKLMPRSLLLSAISEAGGEHTKYLTLPNVIGTHEGVRGLALHPEVK